MIDALRSTQGCLYIEETMVELLFKNDVGLAEMFDFSPSFLDLGILSLDYLGLFGLSTFFSFILGLGPYFLN